MSHFRGRYSVKIPDNQKELNRRDDYMLQLKRENEANIAKIKQLTADLQTAHDEIQNQNKLIGRLRQQIEQLRADQDETNRHKDELEESLSRMENDLKKRDQDVLKLQKQLADQNARNDQIENDNEELLRVVQQLQRDLESEKKRNLEDAGTKDQIKKLKKMVNKLKAAETEGKAAKILLQFNDRFDEVLGAISNCERRIDGGSKSRSKRILTAIDDLSYLLMDDDNNIIRYESLLKKLNSLKNSIKNIKDDDEFYFVPTGSRTTYQQHLPVEVEPDENNELSDDKEDAQSQDKQTFEKRRSKKGEKYRPRHVPVMVTAAPQNTEQTILYIPTQKRPRRYDYRRCNLAITSRPEKIAKAHTRAVMKALSDGYY